MAGEAAVVARWKRFGWVEPLWLGGPLWISWATRNVVAAMDSVRFESLDRLELTRTFLGRWIDSPVCG